MGVAGSSSDGDKLLAEFLEHAALLHDESDWVSFFERWNGFQEPPKYQLSALARDALAFCYVWVDAAYHRWDFYPEMLPPESWSKVARQVAARLKGEALQVDPVFEKILWYMEDPT